jgi:hypothetical protein
MQLDEFYSVEADGSCWTLSYAKPTGKTSPTTGEPTFSRDYSYHANLKQALTKYLDECLKPSSSLQDVLNRITEAESNIESLKIGASK